VSEPKYLADNTEMMDDDNYFLKNCKEKNISGKRCGNAG